MSRARDLANVADDVSTGTVVTTASPSLGRRNLIINGAMQVAQRGTSTSGITGTGYYAVDRFEWDLSSLGTHTVSQSTDAPDGFSNSSKIEVTTADASPTTNNRLAFLYFAEGQDLQALAYGSSGAKSITLSFYVKSNKTGTYSNELVQQDNSSKHYSFDYTINSANTWEYKTITFAGDASGVIDNDNGIGLQVKFWLGAGPTYTSGTYSTGQWQSRTVGNAASSSSPNVADTVGNTWQITGVQLEVGTVATPFEHRSYGEELALCQRYYQQLGRTSSDAGAIVGMVRNTHFTSGFFFTTSMRAAPTGVAYGSNSTSGTIQIVFGTTTDTGHTANSSDVRVELLSTETGRFRVLSTSGSNGEGAYVDLGTGSSQVGITLDAEL